MVRPAFHPNNGNVCPLRAHAEALMRAAASEELMKPIFHSNLEITDVTIIAIDCII